MCLQNFKRVHVKESNKEEEEFIENQLRKANLAPGQSNLVFHSITHIFRLLSKVKQVLLWRWRRNAHCKVLKCCQLRNPVYNCIICPR